MDELITATATTDSKVILEHNQRLSRSALWRLQRKFYEQRGVEAWSTGTVPHYITGNPFIADAYAKVVLGFLRDCGETCRAQDQAGSCNSDPAQPVYIVELGCGGGRFAFYFLKSLLKYKPFVLESLPFKYVMTDFAERNVDFCSSHPALQCFVEQGVLDFARYDVTADRDIRLRRSGRTLSPGTDRAPLAVIANYFFDSIPQDAFYVEGEVLHECLVSLSAPEELAGVEDPELLRDLQVSFENYPISSDYYDSPDLNGILEEYRRRLPRTTLLFPCAAIEGISHLSKVSDGRMLLLSADKGLVDETALLGGIEPKMNLHGSFSMMVNYHALASYTRNQGGRVLRTSHRRSDLSICALLFGDHPTGFAQTQLAYGQAIETGGPDDFFNLRMGLTEHYKDLTLEQLLALLRLTGWDPRTLLDSFPALLDQVESASEPLRQELYQSIHKVWDNYYHIGEERDIAFCMALLLYGMQDYLEALDYFQRSLDLYGPDASTFYNMAMCHYCLRQLDAALESISQTLSLDPSFEAAKAMRIKLQSEIASRSG